MPAVRAVDPLDVSAILSLNNERGVELGLLSDTALRAHLAVAAFARVVGPVGQPHAFLLTFDHRTPPQGPNHAWFLARRAAFLYVDRVCVAAPVHQQGIARALYEDGLAFAAERNLPVLCCEVNTQPPNPRSDAFHARLGFHEVGRAYLADRGKAVRYLERDVRAALGQP